MFASGASARQGDASPLGSPNIRANNGTGFSHGECRPTLAIARRAVEIGRRAPSEATAVVEALLSNALILNGMTAEAYPLLVAARAKFSAGVTHRRSICDRPVYDRRRARRIRARGW